MVDLDKRLRKLEEYQADVAPEPTPVYFEGDPRIDAAGGRCVTIITVDGRKAQEVEA